jgi:alkylation response protein AidB-like acyl-CoA dehydrogenase
VNSSAIAENVRSVSAQFAQERHERQRRRELVKSDFDQLKEAGLHLTGVLAEHGGMWESVSQSTRPICELLRVLAHGDSSIALVSTMHASVLRLRFPPPFNPHGIHSAAFFHNAPPKVHGGAQ